MAMELVRAARKKWLEFLFATFFILVASLPANAADTPTPPGTIGWTVMDWGANTYASTPEEACRRSAENHMGTPLLDMRRSSYSSISVDCKYGHFLEIGGEHWYFTTSLSCELGYQATSDGICVRNREPSPPLQCVAGKPGFMQGNPVMVSSGAKVQREFDLLAGVLGSSKIERTYRLFREMPPGASGGGAWSFWFDRSFTITDRLSSGQPTRIEGSLGDGTYFRFVWNATSQKYESSLDSSATLEALDPLYESWLLIHNGRADRYKKLLVASGEIFILLSSQALDGSSELYSYAADNARLQEIRDDHGRKFSITWKAENQIASISSPDGKALYRYDYPWGEYESWGAGARLIAVDYVDLSGLSLGSKQYHYEDNYNPFLLTGITDENGKRFAAYAYDGNGRAVVSEHANGTYRYQFNYPDINTRIIIDPMGAQRTIGLQQTNERWLVVNESQPGGSGCSPGSNAIMHDLKGNVSSQIDFNGNKTCFGRNARGLETSQVSGLLSNDTCPTNDTAALPRLSARRTTTQWHPDFTLQVAVAEPNRITNYVYNGQQDSASMIKTCAPGALLPNGKPLPLLCTVSVQETNDANGANGLSAQRIGVARIWSYNYDANGRLLTSIGPRNANGISAIESRIYYQDDTESHRVGDLASVTNAAGEMTHYLEYSPSGLVTRLRQSNGQHATFGYGPGERLLSIELDDGRNFVERSEFQYDPVGNLIRAINPDGSSVTYTYDDAHRLTDVTDNAGNRRHMELDGMGNVVLEQIYGPVGELTWELRRTFDALNRLQFEQRGRQQAGTSFEYDRSGNLTKFTDQLGRSTTRIYDGFNRVTREQLPTPSSNSTRHFIDYTYDQQDQLLTVRDPKGFITRYTVDGFGQRAALISPDTGTSSFMFDGAGNLTSSTDARNTVTSYIYDMAGRVTRAGTSTFEYGAPGTAEAGKLIVMRDDSGQTDFEYDGFGRLISKIQNITGGSTRTFRTRYTYGANGTSTGHISSMTYPSGNRIDIGYDSVGRPSSLKLSTPGATTPIILLNDITYRPFGAVSGWVWASGLSKTNKYVRQFELDGKIISYPLGYSGINGVIRTLHYDAAGRITSTTNTGTAQAGALDQTYYYDDLDRLTGFDAASTTQRYRYDKNGNRTEATFGVSTYNYTLSTSNNQLVATTGPLPAKTNSYDAAGNLTGDGTISYTYGVNGRMETSSVAGVVTRYRYNGRGERVAKTSSGGLSYYVYDEQGHLLGEYDASGTPIQETVYLGDLPVAVVTPGVFGPAVYYVYADHLQTPRVLIRASDSRMVWRWDHADPFGLIQPDENPSGLGKFTFNLRFPGQVFDKETNNHYNYFRDYDPQLGRFIQSDPIGLSGGRNTYTYVENSPVKLTDSTGEAPDQWWRPCNTSQVATCVAQCESQGKEFESCAVRWMSGKGVKKPWAGTPSNGGLSCSCKEKQPEAKSFCGNNPKTCAIGGVAIVGACLLVAPEVAVPAILLGGAASK